MQDISRLPKGVQLRAAYHSPRAVGTKVTYRGLNLGTYYVGKGRVGYRSTMGVNGEACSERQAVCILLTLASVI